MHIFQVFDQSPILLPERKRSGPQIASDNNGNVQFFRTKVG